MAAIPSAHPANSDLSADARWWWNGDEWIPATSADGLWSWDGSAWRPAKEFPESDPGEIASRIQELASDHFAAAGHILVHRAGQWIPGPALGEAVRQAEELTAELATVERELVRVDTQAGHGLTAVIARLSGLEEERNRLVRQREHLHGELRAATIRIGQGAPERVLKEADEDLATARRLQQLGEGIASAQAAHVAAEAEWRGRVAAAQEELRITQARREQVLAGVRADLSRAEAEWRERVRQAWRELARSRMPGPGPEVARLGDLVLHERALVTPNGRGRVAEAETRIAPALELCSHLGEELDEMLELEVTGASAFHDALSEDESEPFLFVRAGSLRVLVPIGQHPDSGRDMQRRIRAGTGPATSSSSISSSS